MTRTSDGRRLRFALLQLDLLDRDGDRDGQRLVEAVGDPDAVRVVHAEPGPRCGDDLGLAPGHAEFVVQEIAAPREWLAVRQRDREPVAKEREQVLFDV